MRYSFSANSATAPPLKMIIVYARLCNARFANWGYVNHGAPWQRFTNRSYGSRGRCIAIHGPKRAPVAAQDAMVSTSERLLRPYGMPLASPSSVPLMYSVDDRFPDP
jgi:hypothetical protein